MVNPELLSLQRFNEEVKVFFRNLPLIPVNRSIHSDSLNVQESFLDCQGIVLGFLSLHFEGSKIRELHYSLPSCVTGNPMDASLFKIRRRRVQTGRGNPSISGMESFGSAFLSIR